MMPQQRRQLVGRPVQVVGRQQPQRDDLDADLLAPAEQRLDVVGAGLVALRGVGADGLGPAPVAVEHHADVLGDAFLGQAGAASGASYARVEHAAQATLPVRHAADGTATAVPTVTRRRRTGRRNLTVAEYLRDMSHPVTDARRAPASSSLARPRRGGRRDRVAEVKPQLRGWLHLGTAPLTLAAGIVLIALSPDAHRPGSARRSSPSPRCCCSRVSAIYHRGTLVAAGPRRSSSASTTPTSSCSSPAPTRRSPCCCSHGDQRSALLLAIVWVGAVARRAVPGASGSARRAGSTRRSTSRSAGPRSSTSGVLRRRQRSARHRHRVIVLIAVGGALYTLGGVVYGFKRPNPSPRWFGFHEVFHAFTIAGVRRPLRRRRRWRSTPPGRPPEVQADCHNPMTLPSGSRK